MPLPVKSALFIEEFFIYDFRYVKLTPARQLSLEQVLSFIQDDEVVEVTPKGVRMRKKELDPSRRKSKSKKLWDDYVFE